MNEIMAIVEIAIYAAALGIALIVAGTVTAGVYFAMRLRGGKR